MKKLRITIDGTAFDVEVEVLRSGEAAATPPPPPPSGTPPPASAPASPPTAGGEGTDIPSPLSGTVAAIHVGAGDSVHEGQQLLTLEAMKMNTLVTAPYPARVVSVAVSVGDTVEEGQDLLRLSPA